MFFQEDFQESYPETEESVPEKTGCARFFEILQAECGNLLKANLLFLLTCLPLVTIPLAIRGMNQIIFSMLRNEPANCSVNYRNAFREKVGQSYGAFILLVVPVIFSAFGASFYLRYAAENPLFFLPFMFCSTIFLVTLLASPYLYGILATGKDLLPSLRLALKLGLGKPLRALLAIVFGYGLLTAALLAFPLSLIYLLLIGFSFSCFICNFFIRTILKQFCSQ